MKELYFRSIICKKKKKSVNKKFRKFKINWSLFRKFFRKTLRKKKDMVQNDDFILDFLRIIR